MAWKELYTIVFATALIGMGLSKRTGQFLSKFILDLFQLYGRLQRLARLFCLSVGDGDLFTRRVRIGLARAGNPFGAMSGRLCGASRVRAEIRVPVTQCRLPRPG